ncbi:hypothetical protein Afil01_10490 [Actinorhabdospora filicis]|uniref:Uncharacterized protein n=1 Tax=Actinorhabdospora filicis TaxID=1785913 RepID=A0A9W6SHV8_9ACTN|nr:hypothetical protein [Actinorhabdospora filicis]GLZ76242.1 hypothetical protein Afil01_10490 [Actinorhabdospora filicis]
MRLTGHRWRTVVHTARTPHLPGHPHRVIRPARPPAHASLRDGYLGWHMSVDKAAARDLALAWWLASRSPRSLIHLPLRSSPVTCGEEYGGRRLDLVLLHHGLGFPVSRWKAVRARAGVAAARTITLPERAFRAPEPGDRELTARREFRDRLAWDVAADTLFVVGSRLAFELAGESLRALAEDCPAHLAADPDAHCCAEIGLGRPRGMAGRNSYGELHVQICNRHA